MKKIIGSILTSFILLVGLFLFFEADLVGAANQTASTTPTSTLNFNVTLTVGSEISLTCPSTGDVALSGISGLTGGSSNVTANCGVNTNSAGGYGLWIKASSAPALVNNASSSIYFDDYRTASPEYTWTTAAASSSFGFAVSSTDVVTAFKSNGVDTCGTGSTVSYNNCFRSLNGASNIAIASKAAATSQTVTTTINFKAEVGASRNQPTGDYTATITVTAATQ